MDEPRKILLLAADENVQARVLGAVGDRADVTVLSEQFGFSGMAPEGQILILADGAESAGWGQAVEAWRGQSDVATLVLDTEAGGLGIDYAASSEALEEDALVHGVSLAVETRRRALRAGRGPFRGEELRYAISHDLGAPLRTVRGFAELLEADLPSGDSELQSYLKFVLSGIRRAQDMTHALALLVQAETRANLEVLDVARLCALAESEVQDALCSATMTVHCQNSLPMVVGDEAQLVRMISELFLNAGKYSSGTEVRLEGEATAGRLRVSIRDNGTGLVDAGTRDVFALFERPHQHRDVAGVGGGLAVARQIAEAHGGTLRFEEEHQPGVALTFDLPLAKPASWT